MCGIAHLGQGSINRISTDYHRGRSWSEITDHHGSRVNELAAWIGDVMRTTNDVAAS